MVDSINQVATELALESRGSQAISSYSLQGHETVVPYVNLSRPTVQ
jgi:hypothetical protein